MALMSLDATWRAGCQYSPFYSSAAERHDCLPAFEISADKYLPGIALGPSGDYSCDWENVLCVGPWSVTSVRPKVHR